MEMSAYDEFYLEDAMQNLGDAFDYAVNCCGVGKDDFMEMFLHSGYAEAFGRGESRVVAGMSGIELAELVMKKCGWHSQNVSESAEMLSGGQSADFWCGWVLAYAQWRTGRSFRNIAGILSMKEIGELYPVLHEASEEKFVDVLEQRAADRTGPTHLQVMRKSAGFTQAELARRSQVSLRSIQQYEQRSKEINKAQAIFLYRLASVLGCSMESLLEM